MAENIPNKTEICRLLRDYASNAFIVYMKTYAVHWNITGPKFFAIHKLTDEQYRDQADAIDTIAERIRALGGNAPISLTEILENSQIKELSNLSDRGDAVLEDLVKSNERLSLMARQLADTLDEMNDRFSHDLIVDRIGSHEKAAWMLHSLLE